MSIHPETIVLNKITQLHENLIEEWYKSLPLLPEHDPECLSCKADVFVTIELGTQIKSALVFQEQYDFKSKTHNDGWVTDDNYILTGGIAIYAMCVKCEKMYQPPSSLLVMY